MDWLSTIFGPSGGSAASPDIFSYYTFAVRLILPALALVILIRCGKSLLRGQQETELWGYLSLPNGSRISLYHWENIIGRAKSSDVYLEYPTLSRIHAALIRDDEGDWTICDLGSKGGVLLNGKKVEEPHALKHGDLLSLGGVEMVFIPLSGEEVRQQAESRTKPGREIKPGKTLFFLTCFQLLLGLQHCVAMGDEVTAQVPIGFLAITVLMWLVYCFTRAIRRVGFEVETIAFFLCTIGLSVVATSTPAEMYKQILFLVLGILVYLALGWFLRDLDRAKKMRWPIAALGIAFLAFNVIVAEVTYGAKNWISLGGITFQPSEFVKICFVFAGAATLDRLFAKRNLLLFLVFAGACVGALVLMSDFGTAIVFFAAYLVIAFLRSGSFATIFLSIAGAGFAGVLAISLKPYIADRFATWGKAWEYVNEGGYQQTRTMAAAASGGLFGLGGGKGWLQTIFAADTDMVFGIVCEELGFLIALMAIAALVILAFFAVKSAAVSRSTFYVIASCAAVTILLFQMMLNVFGSLDILPFTGVTFPFVSKGGSSLISCWGLIAFVKAADMRQNASFAVRLPKRKKRIPAEERIRYEES